MGKKQKKSLEKITGQITKLKAIYREIDEKRDLWERKVKKLIVKTFKEIKKSVDSSLKVRINEDIINLESVVLTFGVLNSGLFIEGKGSAGELPPMVLIKRGGYLAYSQMANARISVFVQMPFIEGIYGDAEDVREIGVFEPGEITRRKIIEHVEFFLDEIIKWEREEKKLIGFHIKRH
jgi:hypothetical protein